MSANPLVAPPVDTATATSGTFLVDDIVTLSQAIHDGNWIEAGLAGFATAMDGLSAAIDPLGSLIAMGVGWVLDHIDPLKSWLNDLTGDAGAVLGFSHTWGNVAQALAGQANTYRADVGADLAGMHGAAIAAYRSRAGLLADFTSGAGRAAAGISGGLQLASTLVQFVHDLVRDTISELVGSCGSALAWAATGVGIPYAISIVSEKAAALSARIGSKVTGLVRSISKLDGLLRQLDTVVKEVDDAIRTLLHGTGSPGVPHPHPGADDLPGPRPGGDDVPGSRPDDWPAGASPDGTTPDGTTPGPDGPGQPYDPDAPVPDTVPAKDAPARYTPEDVQHALDNAPVDAQGRPVDPRTGEPLVLQRSDGTRGWEMRWDPDKGEWIAQNHGGGHPDGMPAHGQPGSFGYDELGNRMPYANHRPDYADGQVEAVWRAADEDGDGIVTVLDADDNPVQIRWSPGQPRDGLWDMGHLPEAQYRDLRNSYLNHEITQEEFLRQYHNPANYQVENPGRNRSHVDELP